VPSPSATLRPIDATLSVARAARVLGVHPNTIRAWSDAGRLRYYRINDRGDRRYRQSDLQRFLATAAGTSAAGTDELRRSPRRVVRSSAPRRDADAVGATLLELMAELAALAGAMVEEQPGAPSDRLDAAVALIAAAGNTESAAILWPDGDGFRVIAETGRPAAGRGDWTLEGPVRRAFELGPGAVALDERRAGRAGSAVVAASVIPVAGEPWGVLGIATGELERARALPALATAVGAIVATVATGGAPSGGRSRSRAADLESLQRLGMRHTTRFSG
jgi:excisionase family DNA binding protein